MRTEGQSAVKIESAWALTIMMWISRWSLFIHLCLLSCLVLWVTPLWGEAKRSWSIREFGAKCDALSASDAAISAGSSVLTTSSGNFSKRDVGKSIAVLEGGAIRKRQTDDVITRGLGRETLFTTITAVDSSHRIRLADRSTTSADTVRIVWATDDSKAIQRAIEHASIRGSLSVSGACGIGSSGWTGLVVNGRDGLSFAAAPSSARLEVLAVPTQQVSAGGKSVVLLLKSSKGIRISGLDIDGNGVDANLIGLEKAASSRVEDNQLHDTGSEIANGVFSIGGRGNTYSGNTVFQCGRGLWIGNNGRPEDVETNATIVHNMVRDNIFSGVGGTLQNSVIDRNTIIRNGGSCIPLGSTPVALYRNVSITRNTCDHNLLHGIQSDAWALDPTEQKPERLMIAAPRQIKVSENNLSHNGHDGIMVVYAQDWTITNNRIWDNNQNRQQGYGVEIEYASRIELMGNTIFDDQTPPTQTAGVFLTAYDTPLSVRQISIVGNTISHQCLYGIHLTRNRFGTSSEIQISQNRLLSNGRYGIVINEGSQAVKVLQNKAQDNRTADFRTDVKLQEDSGNKFRTREP